ncbi:uncharacterized protein BDV14DRAFT_210696 [Aspergillus stella-maris]|uniref:uncharacterized protein n=1 Tax=Aspergillus stella-maris TaxID=1810926 RepID=UPI003CCD3BD5
MSNASSRDVERRAPVEVVIPTPHRSRSMLGWAMLQPGEVVEPSQFRKAGILQEHILPDDAKRNRTSAFPVSSTQPSQEPTEDAESGADDQASLKRQITRLRIEIDLRAVAEAQEVQRLKTEVKRLDNLRAELNKTIDRLISNAVRVSPTQMKSTAEEDSLLRRKEKVIEAQISTIKGLESSLSRAYEHDALRSKIRDIDLPTNSVVIADAFNAIMIGVIRVADLLSSCLHPPRKIARAIQANTNLKGWIENTVGNNNTLQLNPDLVLRAMLFRLIRDQILCSEIWTAVHTEGLMLRAYQRAVQQTAGSDFAETFHKAALLHMLHHDSDFEACFINAHAKELQLYAMTLLDPLLDPARIAACQTDLSRVMNHHFCETFSFRARCLAPDGIRYEVIQFEPGAPFDPDTMEPHPATGDNLSDPKVSTIRFCVHGLVVAHEVIETELEAPKHELARVKEMSQPFILFSKPRARNGAVAGKLISGKAIVVVN